MDKIKIIIEAIIFIAVVIWIIVLLEFPEEIFNDKTLSKEEKEKYKSFWTKAALLTAVIVPVFCYIVFKILDCF